MLLIGIYLLLEEWNAMHIASNLITRLIHFLRLFVVPTEIYLYNYLSYTKETSLPSTTPFSYAQVKPE